MSDDWKERLLIRELVENWAVWRDAGDWERFRTVWHDDGRMMATWFQGTADEFIKVSREGFEKGVSILHFLGGMGIDIAENRAIAQTKMTINQRASVDGVVCDVVCTGRFYDFWRNARGDGAWCCGSRSTRRIGSTPWIPLRLQRSIGSDSKASQSAIATSPICSQVWVSRSSRTCPA